MLSDTVGQGAINIKNDYGFVGHFILTFVLRREDIQLARTGD